MALFAAGAKDRERIALGGNRVGKSWGIGAYETALHLTGLYPDWWEGAEYAKQITGWACGTKSVKTRDVNQKFLLGKLSTVGGMTTATGGLIPRRRIIRVTRKSGVADAVDTAWIRHTSGWENTLNFKSYEEGRTAFEAEAIDWIWSDEEMPRAIYDEMKQRLLTTQGHLLATFTPLGGMNETTMQMLKGTDLI